MMDNTLRLALETWPCKEMKKKYGHAQLQNLRPGLMMGTSVHNHIIDCAHFSKIRMIEDLERETKWDSSTEFSTIIIGIITNHYPLPATPLSSTTNVPFESHSQSSTSAIPSPLNEASRAHRQAPSKCSVCGVVGHTSMSYASIYYLMLISYCSAKFYLSGQTRQGEHCHILNNASHIFINLITRHITIHTVTIFSVKLLVQSTTCLPVENITRAL